jgi:tRNA A37 threonylcarbamoyladenosine biosynthesis protein TsaE
MDMYRLEDKEYFIKKGMLQQIDEFDYVIIERPRFTELYAEGYTTIKIDKIGENEREVIII